MYHFSNIENEAFRINYTNKCKFLRDHTYHSNAYIWS